MPNEHRTADPAEVQRGLARLEKMIEYCTSSGCLRAKLLRYFDETTPGYCGNCGNCSVPRESVDATEFAVTAINLVKSTGGYFGAAALARLMTGSLSGRGTSKLDKYKDHAGFGAYSKWTALRVDMFVNALIEQQYLISETQPYHRLRLSPLALEALAGKRCLIDIPAYNKISETTPESPIKAGRKSRRAPPPETDGGLFEELRALRQTLASNQRIPAYLVFSNATLFDMCAKRPRTLEQFMAVNGVGEHKAGLYAHAFLERIRKFDLK